MWRSDLRRTDHLATKISSRIGCGKSTPSLRLRVSHHQHARYPVPDRRATCPSPRRTWCSHGRRDATPGGRAIANAPGALPKSASELNGASYLQAYVGCLGILPKRLLTLRQTLPNRCFALPAHALSEDHLHLSSGHTLPPDRPLTHPRRHRCVT
jgi:hypothetical protein